MPTTTGPTTSGPGTPDQSYYLRLFTKLAAAGLVVVALVTLYRAFFGTSDPPKETIIRADTATKASLEQLKKDEQEAQERRALAKTKRDRASFTAKDVLERLGVLEAEMKQWEAQIPPLLGNEDGRRLATKTDHVTAFIRLYEDEASERPGRGAVQAARERVSELLKPVDEASKDADSLYAPTDQFMVQLTTEKTWAENTRLAYERPRREILVMLSDMRNASPGALTLQEAMESLKRERARERTQLETTQEERRARERKAKETEVAEAIHQAELARIEAQKPVEVARIERNQEQDAILKEASDRNIQRKFAPFLDNGTFAYGPGGTVSQPWSYTRLSQIGVMSSFDKFMHLAMTNADHHRERWPKPLTAQQKAEYEQRWEQFKRLAPVWRDLGLLSP